jgi:hypothetical protein
MVCKKHASPLNPAALLATVTVRKRNIFDCDSKHSNTKKNTFIFAGISKRIKLLIS